MQGIDATFDGVSFERGRDARQALLKIVPGAAALALAGSIGVWSLQTRQGDIPDIVVVLPAEQPTAASGEASSKPFGDIIIDPDFLAEMKPVSPGDSPSLMARLEATPAAPSATVPSAPSAAMPLPDVVPFPPKRDVPQIGDSAPLPPPRPPELGVTEAPSAPERQVALPNAKTAPPVGPTDNRNIFQKLLGFIQPGSGQPSRSVTPQGRVASVAPDAHSTFSAPDGRVTGRPLFGFGFFSAPVSGYDRYTAVYDISARTVYLPDGTRLEAHSGLGDRLDDPRYVSERMRGPTPPNVYELEPREASFHGVQALRLIPVGDNTLYGRAGLLAHSYMLGPNGDSNGCVSFRDYDAFLRAYQNGQVKKLVVVTRL
jgi:hypothetical protein